MLKEECLDTGFMAHRGTRHSVSLRWTMREHWSPWLSWRSRASCVRLFRRISTTNLPTFLRDKRGTHKMFVGTLQIPRGNWGPLFMEEDMAVLNCAHHLSIRGEEWSTVHGTVQKKAWGQPQKNGAFIAEESGELMSTKPCACARNGESRQVPRKSLFFCGTWWMTRPRSSSVSHGPSSERFVVGLVFSVFTSVFSEGSFLHVGHC